jgi:hypothetical protein
MPFSDPKQALNLLRGEDDALSRIVQPERPSQCGGVLGNEALPNSVGQASPQRRPDVIACLRRNAGRVLRSKEAVDVLWLQSGQLVRQSARKTCRRTSSW